MFTLEHSAHSRNMLGTLCAVRVGATFQKASETWRDGRTSEEELKASSPSQEIPSETHLLPLTEQNSRGQMWLYIWGRRKASRRACRREGLQTESLQGDIVHTLQCRGLFELKTSPSVEKLDNLGTLFWRSKWECGWTRILSTLLADKSGIKMPSRLS